jgi:hypothetical protein
VTAAPQHPDLHERVDKLSPTRADALRAVLLLVTPASCQPERPSAGRTLAVHRCRASRHGITARVDELLADGIGEPA